MGVEPIETDSNGGRTGAEVAVTGGVRRPYNRKSRSLGEWRSLVARCVRDAEAPGSNPGSPTISPQAKAEGRPFQ